MVILATLKSEQLNLPESIAGRLKGKDIEIFETHEGFLLKPKEDPITSARGCIKGLGLTSQRYMKAKETEKELER